ncbi:hypothetical protein KIW84_064869 [Lathyrus oleraceus]|uniref:Uncharacterized protein n=1 Tax=Pisum sativum TaxID=3888 RepID=A0A9D5A9C5_PEA|nr:hypothetical protein KIW84_064869 [Pisum sativum]
MVALEVDDWLSTLEVKDQLHGGEVPSSLLSLRCENLPLKIIHFLLVVVAQVVAIDIKRDGWWWFEVEKGGNPRKEKDGRNHRAIVDALEAMANVMVQVNEYLQANHNQNGGANVFCRLEKFQRNNPPAFKGRYDPEGA